MIKKNALPLVGQYQQSDASSLVGRCTTCPKEARPGVQKLREGNRWNVMPIQETVAGDSGIKTMDFCDSISGTGFRFVRMRRYFTSCGVPLGRFFDGKNDVSGSVYAVDDRHLLVRRFNYDGKDAGKSPDDANFSLCRWTDFSKRFTREFMHRKQYQRVWSTH